MKKILVLSLTTLSLFAMQSKFIQKFNVKLNMDVTQSLLNKITNLNKEVKNNKKCQINENIKYLKDSKFPYNVILNVSCGIENNDDNGIQKIKNKINEIVNSKDAKVLEYSTATYKISEEKYKNEKEFLDKHKDVLKMLNKALMFQQQMQQEMQKELNEMQKLFNF